MKFSYIWNELIKKEVTLHNQKITFSISQQICFENIMDKGQSLYNKNFFPCQNVSSFAPVNPLPHNPDFLTTLRNKALENIVEKGENAGNQHFLLFTQCFLT